jgi:hypothetical protein
MERHYDGVMDADQFVYKEPGSNKMYIISKDKLASISEPKPAERSALLEYFKKHADKVQESEPSPVCIVGKPAPQV